jgi:hypothetical protein
MSKELIPDNFSVADALRRWPEVVEILRNGRQVINIDVISATGKLKRIQVSPKSLNATLDLRDRESGIGGTNPPAPAPGNVCPETLVWKARALAAGGTFLSNSLSICFGLCEALAERDYKPKIVALYPLLGGNVATARVPLIDKLGVGIATNNNFVDADFSQMTGLQGDGSTKSLDTLISAAVLDGAGIGGGLGYWELSAPAAFGPADIEPMGSYGDGGSRPYSLVAHGSGTGFRWGSGSSGVVSVSGPAFNAHYYGQRNSDVLREFFLSGELRGSDTTSIANTGAGDRTITILAVKGAAQIDEYAGRCGVAYMTSGNMTAAEVSDFHALLYHKLMVPTGRIAGSGATFPNPTENPEETECEACINSVLVSRVSGLPLASRVSGKLLQTRI